MRDNDIWFKYRKNRLNLRATTWEGCFVLTVVLITLIGIGFYVLDGEGSLKKSINGLLSLAILLTILYIIIDKKGKKE